MVDTALAVVERGEIVEPPIAGCHPAALRRRRRWWAWSAGHGRLGGAGGGFDGARWSRMERLLCRRPPSRWWWYRSPYRAMPPPPATAPTPNRSCAWSLLPGSSRGNDTPDPSWTPRRRPRRRPGDRRERRHATRCRADLRHRVRPRTDVLADRVTISFDELLRLRPSAIPEHVNEVDVGDSGTVVAAVKAKVLPATAQHGRSRASPPARSPGPGAGVALLGQLGIDEERPRSRRVPRLQRPHQLLRVQPAGNAARG